MKQPVTITAAHLDVSYTTDQLMGRAELSLEIGGKWVKVIAEQFDPGGFHVSHIVEGGGIRWAHEAHEAHEAQER